MPVAKSTGVTRTDCEPRDNVAGFVRWKDVSGSVAQQSAQPDRPRTALSGSLAASLFGGRLALAVSSLSPLPRSNIKV